MKPTTLIEPRLLLRGLRISLPPDVTLDVDDTGLAGTDSAVEFCDFHTDGEPGVVKISVACRVVD